MTPYAQQLKKSKIFTVFDGILIAVMLILCILPFFFRSQSEGASVKITHNGKSVTYSLSENRTLDIDGAIIKIENGKVCFESNDCPTKQCVHTGKISQSGQVAVCMPKAIYIQILGSQFDGSVR